MSNFIDAEKQCQHSKAICTCAMCLWQELIKTQSQLQAADELGNWLAHDTKCILSQWSQGRATENGGYETMYAGKWYQSKPIDKTPKCNCGLDEALAAYQKVRKNK